MSRRVFTKRWAGKQIPTGAVESTMEAVQSWLVQEDIEVIGVDLSLGCVAPSQNDGITYMKAEVSQTAVFGQDGTIAAVLAQEIWNSTPAGVCLAPANEVVMFPEGFTVPVKEEGYLYLNLRGIGKTAGITSYEYDIVIYYTKRGA